MQRTTGANATVDNKFQDADPGIGQKATNLTAKWFNNVQEELCGVVETSGSTLDGTKTNQVLQAIINLLHPVGSYVHWERDDLTPGQLYNWQTWTEVTGVVLVGRDTKQIEFNATAKAGGEKTHILTTTEMPAHTHASPDGTEWVTHNAPYNLAQAGSSAAITSADGKTTASTGGDQPHNNLQPYRVVRMWRRTS